MSNRTRRPSERVLSRHGYLAERRDEGSKGRFLSKGREFNLLPYYISMFKPEHAKHGERVALRMPVQDCGTFVRVFVPPEGGVSGSGGALSGMRDVMHYGSFAHLESPETRASSSSPRFLGPTA